MPRLAPGVPVSLQRHSRLLAIRREPARKVRGSAARYSQHPRPIADRASKLTVQARPFRCRRLRTRVSNTAIASIATRTATTAGEVRPLSSSLSSPGCEMRSYPLYILIAENDIPADDASTNNHLTIKFG